MTLHDPSTVLCKDCKHVVHHVGALATLHPYSCKHPTLRSVIDGTSIEILSARHLKCKGVKWEARPPAPPAPPQPKMGFWKRQLYAFLKACPMIY